MENIAFIGIKKESHVVYVMPLQSNNKKMTKQLSQAELEAACLTSALIEIASINTDPKYGYGADTLELVRNHIRGWHRDERPKIFEAIDRIFR